MKKRYPQEEKRNYISDEQYLLLLVRQGDARTNNMSASEFSRNIWLMDEHGNEVWRVYSDNDEKGLEFTRFNRSHSEYLAHRWADDRKSEFMFLLHMESGLATPYPEDKDRHEGPKLELVKKWETRVYLDDEDYLLMDKGLPGTYARNIVRINGKGEEVWRIWAAKADDYDTFSFLFVQNGRCYASRFDRFNYLINVDTGEVTYITWEDM